jgi:hypothetical protein
MTKKSILEENNKILTYTARNETGDYSLIIAQTKEDSDIDVDCVSHPTNKRKNKKSKVYCKGLLSGPLKTSEELYFITKKTAKYFNKDIDLSSITDMFCHHISKIKYSNENSKASIRTNFSNDYDFCANKNQAISMFYATLADLSLLTIPVLNGMSPKFYFWGIPVLLWEGICAAAGDGPSVSGLLMNSLSKPRLTQRYSDKIDSLNLKIANYEKEYVLMLDTEHKIEKKVNNSEDTNSFKKLISKSNYSGIEELLNATLRTKQTLFKLKREEKELNRKVCRELIPVINHTKGFHIYFESLKTKNSCEHTMDFFKNILNYKIDKKEKFSLEDSINTIINELEDTKKITEKNKKAICYKK